MRRGDTAGIVIVLSLFVAASLGLAYATQSQKTIQEGVFTEGQVKQGEKVWEEICSQCHPMDSSGPTT